MSPVIQNIQSYFSGEDVNCLSVISFDRSWILDYYQDFQLYKPLTVKKHNLSEYKNV